MSDRYERTRAALVAQFSSLHPSPFKRALAELEWAALQDAMQRVEVECRTLLAYTPPRGGARLATEIIAAQSAADQHRWEVVVAKRCPSRRAPCPLRLAAGPSVAKSLFNHLSRAHEGDARAARPPHGRSSGHAQAELAIAGLSGIQRI